MYMYVHVHEDYNNLSGSLSTKLVFHGTVILPSTILGGGSPSDEATNFVKFRLLLYLEPK